MGSSMALIGAPVGFASGSVIGIAVCRAAKMEDEVLANAAVIGTVGGAGMLGGIATGVICDRRIANEKERCQELLQLLNQ